MQVRVLFSPHNSVIIKCYTVVISNFIYIKNYVKNPNQKKITIISLISNDGERSYRITFVDFILSVILIYFALQMYDTITMFLASDINVYIEDKVVVKSLTYTMTTLLISTKNGL